MLYLLLGPDDYSKKSFIKKLVKDKSVDLAVFNQDEELPQASRLYETDLFSKAKVFVFEGFMPELEGGLHKIIESPNQVIICLQTFDRRKKENKDLLANKRIAVREFSLPHGLELNKWLENRVKELNGKISKPATEELAVRLGRDQTRETKIGGKVVAREEIFSLWQAESEIKKLLAFCVGRPIEPEDVKQLVLENLEVDAFEIINAIGEGKKQQAFNLMQEFLKHDAMSDEKTAVIQLNALLSEQIRSLAVMQDFIRGKISDMEIIKRTGWKSGRLYILRKISTRLNPQKVLAALPKLEALDEELKSSQTPPKVLLNLVVAQIF